MMPLFKHLWVAKELLHLCAKFYNNPEKELVLLSPKVGILENYCEIQVKCVVSSTGKVDLLLAFNDII